MHHCHGRHEAVPADVVVVEPPDTTDRRPEAGGSINACQREGGRSDVDEPVERDRAERRLRSDDRGAAASGEERTSD